MTVDGTTGVRMGRVGRVLSRLAMEPPFRIFARALLQRLPVSVRTRALWDLSDRPAYLLGLLTAADQAHENGIDKICAIEFGVAGGSGLLALQKEAEAIEREIGVRIDVFGFDNGRGLPELCGDYRDHPDQWRQGDYPLNESALRPHLRSRTKLIIGNIKDTLRNFVENIQDAPVGFVAFDLDLYTSTRDALELFAFPNKNMLTQVPVYFDDIGFLCNHRFAGELLAIEEFNRYETVKIDRWYGVKIGRPFPDRFFLERLYVIHDLYAITKKVPDRGTRDLPLFVTPEPTKAHRYIHEP